MVTYHLKGEVQDLMKADEYNEHRKIMKKAIMDQKIILNGETVDIYDETNDNFKSSDPNDFPKPQIFMIYNSKDEIEPHYHIK